MARLPRLTLPNHLHLVLQRGHAAAPVFVDGEDVAAYLAAFLDVAREWRVMVHGYGFSRHELRLLLTPPDANALSKLMQSAARRHAAWLGRRHGRSGTPWQGRYASAPVEPGPGLFEAMRFVEMADDPSPLASSADHYRGATTLRGLVDPAGYWALGNTPFEREGAYRRLAESAPSPAILRRLRAAVLNGWPVGSAGFVGNLAAAHERPVGPAVRGRPRKADPGGE